MARPRKNNADYFSHDANARHDLKMKSLEAEMELRGYALYFKMLEILAGSDFYEIDISKPYILGSLPSDLGCSKQEFDEFLNLAINLELLKKVESRIYSPGLKKRLAGLDRIRALDRNRKSEIESDKTAAPDFPSGKPLDNSRNIPSKEKERKENKKKEKHKIFHNTMNKEELIAKLMELGIPGSDAQLLFEKNGSRDVIERLKTFERHILNSESYSVEQKIEYFKNLLH